MAKLNLKFVKLFLVALELHFAVLFVGTLVFGHDDNLAWRTAEHSEKQRPICAGQDRVGPKSIYPLWVKTRHLRCNSRCPLYPRKQTCAVQMPMCYGPEADLCTAANIRDAPVRRIIQRAGRIEVRPVLGGLHHQYVRI